MEKSGQPFLEADTPLTKSHSITELGRRKEMAKSEGGEWEVDVDVDAGWTYACWIDMSILSCLMLCYGWWDVAFCCVRTLALGTKAHRRCCRSTPAIVNLRISSMGVVSDGGPC